MLEKLLARLKKAEIWQMDDSEVRLAVAALLAAADRADVSETEIERSVIEDILVSLFRVSREEASELATYGAKVEDACEDIRQLTELIKVKLSKIDRRQLLSDVWQVLVADQEATVREQSFALHMVKLLGLTQSDADHAFAVVRPERTSVSNLDERSRSGID